MTHAEAQAVILIRDTGFELMAKEVSRDTSQLRRTLHNLANNRISGEHGPLFAKALEALGGYQPKVDVRRMVEGKR